MDFNLQLYWKMTFFIEILKGLGHVQYGYFVDICDCFCNK